MKILIVCRGNVKNFNFRINKAYIYEQIESIKKKYNISYDTFIIKEPGIRGYLKSYFKFIKKIKHERFDIVHAHYGISGLLATLQRKVPTIVTFHGSDINLLKVRVISYIAHKLANKSIFVSERLALKLGVKSPTTIPCGVDLEIFKPFNKQYARTVMNLDSNTKYILFSSSFNRKVKNYALANSAVKLVAGKYETKLLELKGYSREEVALLLNAVDLAFMTSLSEGSPQFIKEAMACNCPIVSTDVDDLLRRNSGTRGCFITTYSPEDVANNIKNALDFGQKTKCREKVLEYDNNLIAKKMIGVYTSIIHKYGRKINKSVRNV